MILLVFTYILCALILMLPVLVFVFGRQRGHLARALATDERDAKRAAKEAHNPDLALRQTQAPVKACVAALLISGLTTVVIFFVTWLMGSAYLGSFAQIMPTYARSIAPASPLQASLDLIEADLKAIEGQEENPQARRRLQSIADRESVEFTDPDMAKQMLHFIQNERGTADGGTRHTAVEAYAKFALGWTGADLERQGDSEPAKSGKSILDEYESAIRSSIMPLSLESMSYAQFQQRTAMIQTARSLPQGAEADPQLVALKRSLYRRIVEHVSGFARARQLFCGPIQFLTLTACYLSVILLAIRRERCLLQELAANDRLIADWRSDPDLSAAIAARPSTPGADEWLIVGLGDPPDGDAATREKKVLVRYMELWTDGAQPGAECAFVPHLLAPGLAHEVIKELLRPGGSLISAQELLDSTAERCETELERVEYSAIDYLIFAIPSLGFIGTVIGIGAALGSADSVVSAAEREEQVRAVSDVTSVLGSAFDTTLIALIASLVAVAILSWVRSGESEMLRTVRHRIAELYL